MCGLKNGGYASLAITLPARWCDVLDGILDETGTLGCQISGDDPATYVAYFEGGSNLDVLERLIRLRLEDAGANMGEVAIARGIVPPTDWEATWRRTLAPVRVGRRWLVRPSWIRCNAFARETLVIDPKMAFGTGTHATTQLCLVEMEELVHAGMSVLDVGTGTGILAIAAAKMGARPVIGVEIDPTAAECARENVRLNGLAGQVEIITGTMDDLPQEKFDFIAANIEYRTLVALAPAMRGRLNPDGFALFSGILQMEADSFVAALRGGGWRPIRMRRRHDPTGMEGWIALVAAPG